MRNDLEEVYDNDTNRIAAIQVTTSCNPGDNVLLLNMVTIQVTTSCC